jgi:hypothetical protein
MSDICACSWLGCNLKKYCYRFTAPKNRYAQTYFLEVPKKIADKECDYFVGNTDYYKANADNPEELQKAKDRIGTPEIDPDILLPF